MNIIFVAQQIVNLNTCQADIASINGQLSHVKIKNTAAINQLAAISIKATDSIDFLAGIFCHFRHLAERTFAAHIQIAPRNIQAGKQQIRSAGSLRQIDNLADIFPIYVRPCQKQRALSEAAAGFVHGNRGHIRTSRHRVHRHVGSKIKMRAMCFVHQAQHIMRVRQLNDRTQIRANTVIGRIIYQNRFSVRIFPDSLFYLGKLHTQGNSQFTIYLRIDIYRNCTI